MVRVTPRSSAPGVEPGGRVIRIRVRAAPADGKATEEARRRLSKALGVAPSSVRIVSGMRSRGKLFEVEGFDQARAELHLRENHAP